jgi:pimeloyl-ACP methyl ester carboxylesterase
MHSLHTHAYADAAVSSAEKKYSLLVFAPGLGEQPTSYADIIEDLVSHGYIVAGIVPTGFVSIVLFPDGRMLRSIPPSSKALGYTDHDCACYGYAAPMWAADMRFVLTQLEKVNEGPTSPLASRIDFSRVGAFGHSLGGSTCTQVALEDSRVKAAVNIDGKIYGTVTQEGLAKPYMFFRSDQSERKAALEKLPAGDFERARYAMMQRDYKSVYASARPGYGLFLSGSVHMFPTDSGLIPFVPESKKTAETGAIGARRAHVITKAYVQAFFDRHLKGKPSSLLDGSSPFPEVTFESNCR